MMRLMNPIEKDKRYLMDHRVLLIKSSNICRNNGKCEHRDLPNKNTIKKNS